MMDKSRTLILGHHYQTHRCGVIVYYEPCCHGVQDPVLVSVLVNATEWKRRIVPFCFPSSRQDPPSFCVLVSCRCCCRRQVHATLAFDCKQRESENMASSPTPSLQAEEILIKNGRAVAKLDPNHALRTISLGERIHNGRCLLKLSNLASAEEVEFLRSSCIQAANKRKETLTPLKDDSSNENEVYLEQGSEAKVFVRLLTQASAERENAPQDVLPEPVSAMIDKILERALTFLDQEACPSIKTTLFGGTAETTSIAQLFRDNQLDYSIREPAINVYEAPHGYFAMHKDHHALSIVMPLSNPNADFQGGGTAFWSQSHPVAGMDGPSIVLKPPAGTALLWGGRVSHKGMRISDGTRVVLVASFSGPQSPRENVRQRLSAGLGVRTIFSGR